jgi:hypothetical protein
MGRSPSWKTLAVGPWADRVSQNAVAISGPIATSASALRAMTAAWPTVTRQAGGV